MHPTGTLDGAALALEVAVAEDEAEGDELLGGADELGGVEPVTVNTRWLLEICTTLFCATNA